MSRIVGGEYIFEAAEKEYFTRRMWLLADFLGIDILDYTVMSNHYHQLVSVRGISNIGDKEMLRRVSDYYGDKSREAKILSKALNQGGEAADRLRAKYLKRMGNISEFQKHLKQGFTTWYNRQRKRRGTLWMERFKSLLAEDSQEVRQVIASYIDLNPVRAELVDDPKNYRHCGYAAALGGDERCRGGIMRVMGCDDWESAAAQYRTLLMVRGHREATGKKGTVSRELLLKTLGEKGHLSKAELLRLRVRYFSDGLVLGSELFVENVFLQHRSHFGKKRKSGARSISGLPLCDLKVIRDLRKEPIS